jgi:hypothetical protein
METLHRKRKGVPAEMKGIKLKKGEHVSVWKDRLMIMMWKKKKKNSFISTTHDKMVQN